MVTPPKIPRICEYVKLRWLKELCRSNEIKDLEMRVAWIVRWARGSKSVEGIVRMYTEIGMMRS